MSKYVDYVPWVRLTLFRLYTMGSRGLHFTVANSFVNFILRLKNREVTKNSFMRLSRRYPFKMAKEN
jgi:hypothetical protein